MSDDPKRKPTGDQKPVEESISDFPEGDKTSGAGRRKSGWNDIFGDSGVFGRDGPFGSDGPFGKDGPFGADGPFGRSGPFGGGASSGPRKRQGRGRSDEWRSGKRKRMFAHGELRLALLLLIADKSRHGYELIKDIEELTQGDYSPSPGAVYPTLQMLTDEGKIEEAPADGAKKPFQATDEGLAELDERKSEVEDLMARLAIHGKRTRDAQSPDIFRAMGNLGAVIGNKARKGGFDKASTDKIVDIIDEVARRIERM